MIYLAAFISKPGQSLLDVEPSDVAQRYLEAPSDPAEDGDYPPRPHSSTNGALTILPCATE